MSGEFQVDELENKEVKSQVIQGFNDDVKSRAAKQYSNGSDCDDCNQLIEDALPKAKTTRASAGPTQDLTDVDLTDVSDDASVTVRPLAMDSILGHYVIVDQDDKRKLTGSSSVQPNGSDGKLSLQVEKCKTKTGKRKLNTLDKSALPFPKRFKRKPGFDQNMFNETVYVINNGLRHVQPYYFTFTAHAKERWFGKTVLDVFKKEFRMESIEFYENAIKTGKITVNDEVVSPDRILRNNDLVKTRIHRHEPPVIHEPLEFIENNDDIVVINKPSSIPVHPCGRYRHNTIVFILGKDYNLENLHTVHRIDRLTSGILMFAKTKQKAQELEKAIKERNVYKEYVCRVKGEFSKDKITCDKPINVFSHNVGVCQVSNDGKPCSTEFQMLSYNGKTSVVKCMPHGGRMHQIRVHLQWLGFPIINDPIYNHLFAWGSNKGKGGTDRTTDQVLKSLASTRKENRVNDITNVRSDYLQGKCKEQKDLYNHRDHNEKNFKNEELDKSYEPDQSQVALSNLMFKEEIKSGDDPTFDPDCSDCKQNWKDPGLSELVMYLHAVLYKGDGWEYKTNTPKWAEVDWTE